jgi:hypothetical protein
MALDGDRLYLVDRAGPAPASRLLVINGPRPSMVPPPGYTLIGADGNAFPIGWTPFYGSDVRIATPIVASTYGTRSDMYWLVEAGGVIHSFGCCGWPGNAHAITSRAVGLAATAELDTFWVLERNGKVHPVGWSHPRAYGNGPSPAIAIVSHGARYEIVTAHPSFLPPLAAPIVAARGTRTGVGTWYVGADGGVLTGGNATFYGSMAGTPLNAPVVDLVPTATDRGYWLIAADGGVFSFGDAEFAGSLADQPMTSPIVTAVPGPRYPGFAP